MGILKFAVQDCSRNINTHYKIVKLACKIQEILKLTVQNYSRNIISRYKNYELACKIQEILKLTIQENSRNIKIYKIVNSLIKFKKY